MVFSGLYFKLFIYKLQCIFNITDCWPMIVARKRGSLSSGSSLRLDVVTTNGIILAARRFPSRELLYLVERRDSVCLHMI
jgi:hypothetical protein